MNSHLVYTNITYKHLILSLTLRPKIRTNYMEIQIQIIEFNFLYRH